MEQKWMASDLARWLRRRRKRRIARQTGESVGHDPDFYDGSDPVDDVIPKSGCLIIIILLIVILAGGAWLVFSGGDETDIIGSLPPVVSSSSSPSSSAPASGSTAGTPAPPPTLPPMAEPFAELLGAIGVTGLDPEALLELRDILGDLVDSIIGVVPPYQGGDVDIAQASALVIRADAPFQMNAFGNTVYACGDADPLVVCAEDILEMPAGDMLVVAVQMDDNIPLASTERSYIYSIVFDSDGDAANDWVFNPPFEWDYFQGADRWYQAGYDHTTGSWLVTVAQLTADGSFPPSGAASAVRLVIDGQWLVWFIPTNEFTTYPAPFRVTAFGHDGFYSEATRGGDVMGADPTERLVVPPADPAFVSGG